MQLEQKLVSELCGREGKRVFVIAPNRNLELNINELHNALKNNGFEIRVKAKLGVTFHNRLDKVASVLRSGIMIIEGAKSDIEAYKFYSEIIIDELKISRSLVE